MLATEKMTENVFNQMEEATNGNSSKTAPQNAENTPKTNAAPVDYTALSDQALGDKVKYVRTSLDGKTVKIKSAELFNADTSEPPITAMNGSGKQYYKFNFILSYDTENNDREYIPGGIQFINKDGGLSDHQFWYDGTGSQLGMLWEAVAKAKGVEPNKLSPREFMGYLNSGVSAVIEEVKGKFQGKEWKKNLVKEFTE